MTLKEQDLRNGGGGGEKSGGAKWKREGRITEMDEAAGGKTGVLREDFMALVRVRSEMQSLEVLKKKKKEKMGRKTERRSYGKDGDG